MREMYWDLIYTALEGISKECGTQTVDDFAEVIMMCVCDLIDINDVDDTKQNTLPA